MKTSIFVIAIMLLLTGCGPSSQEVPSVNRSSLSSSGEVVGNLPDGREVRRWYVWNPDGSRVHWVYVVDGSTTISTNRPEMEGKVSVNRTDVVIINGKKYVPEK